MAQPLRNPKSRLSLWRQFRLPYVHDRHRDHRAGRADDPMKLSYPPPFQDLPTLAAHTCLGESTIERMVKEGRFPPPRKEKCGKRLWVWAEVEKFLAAPEDDEAVLASRILEHSRRFFNG